MKLNEYILIVYGSKTEVFIGANAEQEAFETFCQYMDNTINFYGADNLKFIIGYNDVIFSAKEYQNAKKGIFERALDYGYVHCSEGGLFSELHVFVKGSYGNNIFNQIEEKK